MRRLESRNGSDSVMKIHRLARLVGVLALWNAVDFVPPFFSDRSLLPSPERLEDLLQSEYDIALGERCDSLPPTLSRLVSRRIVQGRPWLRPA